MSSEKVNRNKSEICSVHTMYPIQNCLPGISVDFELVDFLLGFIRPV